MRLRLFQITSIIFLLTLFTLEILLHLLGLGMDVKRFISYSSLPSDPNAFRIMTIGESTTDAEIFYKGKLPWPAQLENMLNRDSSFNQNFKVINMGKSAVNSRYFAERISFLIERYQPDLIIPMIGINEGALVYSSSPKSSWINKLKTVQLFNWLQDLNHFKSIQADAQMKEIISEGDQYNSLVKNFLNSQQNHSIKRINGFIQEVKNKGPYGSKEWLFHDRMALIWGMIGCFEPVRKNFNEWSDYQRKPPAFYQNISINFYKRLLDSRKVGIVSPLLLQRLLQANPKNRTLQAYRDFLFENFNKMNQVIFPASREVVIQLMAQEGYLPGSNAFRKAQDKLSAFQQNYLYIYKTAQDNRIPLFPMQYPRLPISWLEKILSFDSLNLKGTDWFCDEIVLTTHSKRINPKPIIISNEEIRKKCAPTDQDCFYDQFHYCANKQQYSFGHAGPLLDEMIARNAYQTIKKRWKLIAPKSN